MSICTHQIVCTCGVNGYKRYDGPLQKQDNLPRYGNGLKTVYTKDYIPVKADCKNGGCGSIGNSGLNNWDAFANRPATTSQKSPALPGAYRTSYEREYVPKKPRNLAEDAE